MTIVRNPKTNVANHSGVVPEVWHLFSPNRVGSTLQDTRVANRRQNSNTKHDPEYETPPHNSYCAESIPPPPRSTSTQPLSYPTIFGLATTGAALSAAIGANPPGPGKERFNQDPTITLYCRGFRILLRRSADADSWCHALRILHAQLHGSTRQRCMLHALSRLHRERNLHSGNKEGASSLAWRRSAAHGWSRTTRSRHIWHRRRHVLRSFADGTGSDGLTSLAVSEFRLHPVLRKQFG